MLPVGKRPLSEAVPQPDAQPECGRNEAEPVEKRQKGALAGWGGIEWGGGMDDASDVPTWCLTVRKRLHSDVEKTGEGPQDFEPSIKRARTVAPRGWGGIEWGFGINDVVSAPTWSMRRIWTPKQLLALREAKAPLQVMTTLPIDVESSISVGCDVRLTENFHDFGDAGGGPLRPGEVGKVIADDGSDEPYLVQTSQGRMWWYRAGALRLLRGMTRTMAAVPFKVAACRSNICACQICPHAWHIALNESDAFSKYLGFRHLGLLARTNKSMNKILTVRQGTCDPWRTCALASSDERADGMLRVVARYGKTDLLKDLLKEDRTSLDARNDAFLSAVDEGHNESVQCLLKADVDVNKPDRHGETPLLKAIERQDASLTYSLLLANADVNDGRNSKRAPLLRATYSRNCQIVDMLLQAGASVNVTDKYGESGETAVIKALEIQDVGILRMLLNANADVATMRNYTTPLHVAAYHGNPRLVETLLADRDNSRALVNAGDHKHTRPLEDACTGCDCHRWIEEDRVRVVEILVAHGADAQHVWTYGGQRTRRLLLRSMFSLHEACKKKDEDTVQRLLLAERMTMEQRLDFCLPDAAYRPMGLDVNCRDFEGNTPLYLGCRSGNRQIVRMVSFPSSMPLGHI